MSQIVLQGMRKAQEREMLPPMDLYPQVEYAGRKIDASAFGPNTRSENVASMRRRYFHSDDLSNITFEPLSTAQSLAVASYNFANLAKPIIFKPSWLRAGIIVKTQEGVWINPLTDSVGDIIQDEKKLKERLNGIEKVNGIYLLHEDTSFVPYNSFEQGVQEHSKFLEGGLARGLVHTPDKKADTLSPIANGVEYPRGVNVFGFDSVKEPLVKVVSLGSDRNIFGYWLVVNGGLYGSDVGGGYAFGGLVSGEASAQENEGV